MIYVYICVCARMHVYTICTCLFIPHAFLHVVFKYATICFFTVCVLIVSVLCHENAVWGVALNMKGAQAIKAGVPLWKKTSQLAQSTRVFG